MANTTIQLKRSSVPGQIPANNVIAPGELAINLADRLLYSKDTSNNIFSVSMSGPQGAQGAQGFQGSTGPQGPQGAQGDQGDASTVPGPQGPQGYQGAQGDQGAASTIPGPQGPQGYQGAQGDQGDASTVPGPQGPQGYQGAQGDQGTQGSTGPQGPQGAQGNQGVAGTFGGASFYYDFINDTAIENIGSGHILLSNTDLSQANVMGIHNVDRNSANIASFIQTIDDSTSDIKGTLKITQESNTTNFVVYNITGTHTDQGDHFNVPIAYVTGTTTPFANGEDIVVSFLVTGDKGDTGPQGPQGAQGNEGSTGPQGPQGAQGDQGLTGPQGPQGAQGNQGTQGSTGPQGPQGAQGSTGPQGPQGAQGNQGSTGPQGPQGAQGYQGAASTVAGPQGPQGYQGTAGGTGPQGPQGAQGNQGTTGDTGPQGPQGAQGNQGTAGGTGPQGPQGRQGAASTVAGPQGPQGAQGNQGTAGGTGPQGPQGRQGAAGGTGPQGPQGAQGAGLSTTSTPQINALGVNTAAGPQGTIRATSDVIAHYSDERLKTKIEKISDALEKIKSLEGFKYRANKLAEKYGYQSKHVEIGLSAQKVKEILPEIVDLAPFDTDVVDGKIVSRTGENYLTLKYDKIVVLLVEGIKELDQEVNTLKNRVNVLEKGTK